MTTIQPITQQHQHPLLIRYKQLLKQFEDNFQTQRQTVYYVLSTKFIQQWKQKLQDQNTSIDTPQKQLTFNEDIVSQRCRDVALMKQGLQKGEDYIYVNRQIMNFFSQQYQGIQIKRKAYILTMRMQKYIDIHLFPFKYMVVNKQLAKMYLKQQISHFPMRTIYASKNQTLQQFLISIKQIQKNIKAKLWFVTRIQPIEIEARFKKIKNKGAISYDTIQIPATQLQNKLDRKLDEIAYEDNKQFFIYQHIEGFGKLLKSQISGRCSGCNQQKQLTVVCICGKVRFCDENCHTRNLSFHKNQCPKLLSLEKNKIYDMQIVNGSRKGIIGLTNLHNTCYLNSCLQCLSHTKPLVEYFLKDNFMEHINYQNPLGTRGVITKAFADFIYNAWCGKQSTYIPKKMKSALGILNNSFNGYDQHDSNEAFTYIIDGLRQDLNRIKTKPYVQDSAQKQQTEQEVFKKTWEYYLKRNQSIIVDTMTGIFRSKVSCPECDRDSITFEPFISLSLPVLNEKVFLVELKKVDFFHSFLKLKKKNTMGRVYLQQRTTTNLFREMMKTLGINSKTSITFYLLHNSQKPIIRLNQKYQFNQIMRKIDKQGYFLVSLEYEPNQLTQNFQELTFFVSQGQIKQNKIYGMKRPLFLAKNNEIRGKRIYNKLSDYFYNGIYRRKQFISQTKFNEQFNNNYPYKIYLVNYNVQPQNWKEIQLQDIVPKHAEVCVYFENEDKQFDLSLLCKFILHQSVKDQDQKKNNKNNNNNVIRSSKSATLNDCMESFGEPEQLEQGNQWYCKKCKRHQKAYKKLQIYQLPKILTIQLKRFKQRGKYGKEKLNYFINFPVELNMTKYVKIKQPIITNVQQFMKFNLKGQSKNNGTNVLQKNHQNLKNNVQLQQKIKVKQNLNNHHTQCQKDSNENNNHQSSQQSTKTVQIQKILPNNINVPLYNDSQRQKQTLLKQQKFVAASNQGLITKNHQKQVKYKLYAISNHYGGLNSGHYTAYCFHNNKWYQFNDSMYSVVDQSKIRSSGAYMIFYERVD